MRLFEEKTKPPLKNKINSLPFSRNENLVGLATFQDGIRRINEKKKD